MNENARFVVDIEDIAHWRGSLSPPEECPYLPGRVWENFLIDPGPNITASVHEQLLESGFRRMGSMFFQPVCKDCGECRSMRVEVARFKASKSLRKARNRNLDLEIEISRPIYTEEKRLLLENYLGSKHVGPMVADEEGMRGFMFAGSKRSWEMDYFLDGELIAVGLVDLLPNILSSIYFFYDPSFSKRSLGIASMIFELEWAAREKCRWYHPGFMVRDCPAMSYKARFGPGEVLKNDGSWEPLLQHYPQPQSINPVDGI